MQRKNTISALITLIILSGGGRKRAPTQLSEVK